MILNDNIVMLTITKKNGKKRRFFIDAWEWQEVAQYRWYCTKKGYAKTRGNGVVLGLPEIVQYSRFKAENAVWHHKNGMKDDNRSQNLDHVPDWYNKIMNFGRKPGKSGIPGVFLTTSGTYRVRAVDPKKWLPTFKCKWEAAFAHYGVLRRKGIADEDAKRKMGLISRRQYRDEYCERIAHREI